MKNIQIINLQVTKTIPINKKTEKTQRRDVFFVDIGKCWINFGSVCGRFGVGLRSVWGRFAEYPIMILVCSGHMSGIRWRCVGGVSGVENVDKP